MNVENKKHMSDVLADLRHTAKGAVFLNRLQRWRPKATTVGDRKLRINWNRSAHPSITEVAPDAMSSLSRPG